jgi:hypothetical protein
MKLENEFSERYKVIVAYRGIYETKVLIDFPICNSWVGP